MSKQLKEFLYALGLILSSFIMFSFQFINEKQFNIYVVILFILGVVEGSRIIFQIEKDYF
jgi:hypothetical protein